MHVLKRDIVNWKIFTEALGIELYYVLQPVGEWTKKKRTKEEEVIFAQLDKRQGAHWRILNNEIRYDQYVWFSAKMKEICDTADVCFFDMNNALSNMQLDGKWLFVDRAHCTDEGYSIVAKILCEKVAKA